MCAEANVEYWLLGHHQCMDAELRVYAGEFNMTYEDASSLYPDEYVEFIYKLSTKFQKLNLSKEEIIILKTIVLTFTGNNFFVLNTCVAMFTGKVITETMNLCYVCTVVCENNPS